VTSLIVDEEEKEKSKEEDKPPMLVVEIYDPSTPAYRFVREVPLNKSESEPFIKASNSVDFLRDASFATNGQALIIQTAKKVYFFDLKTGIRSKRAKTSDHGVNHDDCRMIYDYQNNLFYSFKYSTADTRMEAFTIENFKKGDASSGFAKEYLGRRVSSFKNTVYGEDLSALASKQAP
jgi:hypothetical protein